MKFFALPLLLTVFSGVSFAQNLPTQVDVARLKLVGRGIINKKTGESLALACVGEPLEGSNEPSCYKMRHVVFSSDLTQVTYLGSEYRILLQENPEDQTVKTMLKDMNHEFKLSLKPKRADRSMKVVMKALPIGLAGAMVGLAVGASGGTIAVAIGGTWAVGAFFSSLANAPISSQLESPITAVRDQTGWSWSERPRRTSNNRYNEYKNFISTTYTYGALK